MKLTCILQVTVQLTTFEVATISQRQLQNSQLHSPGRASRCRRAHGICALPSQFPMILKTWQKKVTRVCFRISLNFRKMAEMVGWSSGNCLSSVYYWCPRKVLAFDQQWNKSLLFKFENLISFISDKAHLKLDFDSKNQTEENEIMCQFKTRYFLNHVVWSYKLKM